MALTPSGHQYLIIHRPDLRTGNVDGLNWLPLPATLKEVLQSAKLSYLWND